MYAQDSLRDYCIRYYGQFRNPHSGATEDVDPGDLIACVELLRSVLEAGPSPKQLEGLEAQFYSAFGSYVQTSRIDIGALCLAVDRLAGLIEPFTKKIAYHFLPEAVVQKDTQRGKRSYPLWRTTNYADILEALGMVTVADLYKDQGSFWRQKPAPAALLRQGFAARQRGAHESRIHTLQELEDTAYSVIGQYVVICLCLLRNPSVTARISVLTEKARVLYLLRERARGFPLTGALLSRREHLLLYRHRKELTPDQSEKRFLFLNYLGGRGPCFYWIRDGTPETLYWARDFYTGPPDEEVRKNAAHYLLRHGQSLPLESLLETFSDYDEKAELAQHLEACTTSRDRALLLSLANDKREEVALEAGRLLTRLPFALNAGTRKLARSRSDAKIRVLRLIIGAAAKASRRDEYRKFASIGDLSLRVAFAYCLGEVGDESDLMLLKEVGSKRRLDGRLREACWYAFARICSRFGCARDVVPLLKRKERIIVFATLDGVTRDAIGGDLRVLERQLQRGRERRRRTSAAILRIAGKKDRAAVQAMFRKIHLDNDSRDLLLALCKVGNTSDCELMLRTIGKAAREVYLYNHVRVAEAVAATCGPRLRRLLKRYVTSPEFWRYIGRDEKRPRSRLPLRHLDNQALYRRLLGACFIKVAIAKDAPLLKRLVAHNYDWIARRAAEKLAEYGREEDLTELNERLLASHELENERQEPLTEALCLLDRKVYGISA